MFTSAKGLEGGVVDEEFVNREFLFSVEWASSRRVAGFIVFDQRSPGVAVKDPTTLAEPAPVTVIGRFIPTE